MLCDDVRLILQEALDGAPLPADAREHLASCEACRALAARLDAVDAFLAEEADLAWDAALTRGILDGVRRDRRQARWFAAAAAVLVSAAALIGADLLADVPAVREAGSAVADRLSLPESPGAAVRSVGEGFTALAESISDRSPVAPGLPVAVGALLILLVLNGYVIGRPLLARRRR